MRHFARIAVVVASGLALGIALVIVVSSVSSGMEKAQGKVLQSLYGLGTDMTVTKAAAAQSTSDRPRFDFDADDGDSDKEQSSDRVMVQGFQTLASSTVAEVDAQKGVADSVGGLSLQVIRINGQFTRGQFKQDPNSGGGRQGGPGGGQGAPQGRVEGGGANFDVNNYSVYGTDVTKPALGPLTSSKITSGRTFKAAETDAKVVVADSAYAKEKKYKVGSTFSETFPTHQDALRAAEIASAEQQVAGATDGIQYEDADGKWHEELADGRDRPQRPRVHSAQAEPSRVDDDH